jgi:hypothetical protein
MLPFDSQKAGGKGTALIVFCIDWEMVHLSSSESAQQQQKL